MKIVEVNNHLTRQLFNNLPRILYKGDNNFTCILDVELDSIFNRKCNSSYTNGDAHRWILIDDYNQPIGRIAAFYNMKKAFGNNAQPTGGIGFFECINNQQAANQLFNMAKAWLVSKGMKAMDGPVNFGENYVHWGLLVEGFTHQAYGMPYNFPYYRTLFEQHGFQTYFEQYSYHVDLTKPLPERQIQFANYIMQKPEFSWEHFSFNNLQKYLNHAVEIYNQVWSTFHNDYTPLTYKDFEQIFMGLKSLLIEDLIVFAYANERPIGIIVTIPDINQAIKSFDGKLNLINKIKLAFSKKRKITRARQLLTGVIPEYQNNNIIAPLFLKMIENCKKHGITELEMSWVGDYNETVIKMYNQMGNATKAKTHITYRYLFDREKPFVRFTNQKVNENKSED